MYGHVSSWTLKCVNIQMYGQFRCGDIQMYDRAEQSVSQLYILTFEYMDI